MTVLSDAEIAGIAKSAGFTGDGLVKAVAVALAESSGIPTQHNAVAPDNSYGLWQINMYGNMGPARRKRYGLKSNTDLYNPAVNAKIAYDLSNGGKSWSSWGAYTNGTYFLYMPRAKKAAGNPDTSSGPGDGTGTAQQVGLIDGMDSVAEFFTFIADPNTWLRLGMMLAGAGLIGFALFQISGESARVAAVVNKVTDVLPPTKALKTAVKSVKAAA